jgi:predicted RNase H-like nuclease (RuvC/YqgF family)
VHIVPLLEFLAVAAVSIGGVLFARRFGGGAALEQLERANSVLTKTVHEQDQEIMRLKRRVAELEGKTDLTIALVPVLEALKTHETEAAKRSTATLNVLDQIAKRLGPEPA